MAGFFPDTDAALLGWSLNFDTLITATPTAYGLTSALATAYGTAHTSFGTALAACDPSIRTKSSVATKNAARTALKSDAKLLANLINGTASVTNAQKLALGLNVKAKPTPIPPPSDAPGLEVLDMLAWTAKIKLRNTASSASRGKPAGVSGASVFTFVGATPPSDLASWQFEGNTGRVNVDVLFPNTIAPGTKVWLCAFWFNGRKQAGPVCAPVATNIQFGGVSMAA